MAPDLDSPTADSVLASPAADAGSPDVQTLYSACPLMFRNNPVGFVLCVILSPVGIGLLIFLGWWLTCRGTRFTVTNERNTLRTGILSKSISEVWHRDVRNVQLYQGPLQRLLGVGQISISSSGQSDVELVVSGIRDPEEVKDLIDRFKRAAI